MSEALARWREHVIKYSGLVILLVLWEAAPRLGWADPQFLPPFSKTIAVLYEYWVKGSLFRHVMVSLWRVLVGLTAATVLSLPIGFLLGSSFTVLEEKLSPLFRIFGQVNPYSLFPLFILFFGVGEVAKIAVVAWVCFWPLLFHILSGVKTVDPMLIKTAKSLNISKSDYFLKILLPASLPSIFLGLRVGVEMSFFILIAAEMVGATSGLGWIVHNAGMVNQVTKIYGAGICIVALGVFMNQFLRFLQNRIFFWKETTVLQDNRKQHIVKKLGKVQGIAIVFAFIIILLLGTWQINESIRLLNDPNALPEYKVYAE